MSFDEYAPRLSPPRSRNVGAVVGESTQAGWSFLRAYGRRAMREVREKRAATTAPAGSVQRAEPPTP